MSHPHPHAFGPAGEPIGHVPPPPDEPLEEPSAANRRLWVVAATLAVIALLAMFLTWQSLRSKHDARTASAAADKACAQVQGLGQKCATQPADEQAAPAQAVIPEPSIAGSLRPAGSASGTPGADESAAQAGQPGGPLVNPGSDLIVGLTLREHRLEITYADGTVVDAGRIEGAPPAIVLPVGGTSTPAADSAGSPQAAPVGSDAPAGSDPAIPAPPAPQISPQDIVPTGGEPFVGPDEERTYVP